MCFTLYILIYRTMKKFTEKKQEDEQLEFKKDKKGSKVASNDIESLDSQVDDVTKEFKLDGEWEIESIIDVSKHKPELNEAIVINAELGDKTVKRGDFIYITALIHRKNDSSYYHQTQMGVIKVRIVDIYNNLLVLNNIK